MITEIDKATMTVSNNNWRIAQSLACGDAIITLKLYNFDDLRDLIFGDYSIRSSLFLYPSFLNNLWTLPMQWHNTISSVLLGSMYR